MSWINNLLQTTEDLKGLYFEVVESFRPEPRIDSRMTSTMMMTSCMMTGFRGVPGINGELIPWDRNMEDAVFRGQESVPTDIFHKRVEEFRKKYPEDFSPIQKMSKLVYGKEIK